MAKKKFGQTQDQAAEDEKEGQMLGFSATGLVTVDLQRQQVRYPTAASFTLGNQPDNRVDIDLTAGTLKIPPGWRTIVF
jgi:hypothetical protein